LNNISNPYNKIKVVTRRIRKALSNQGIIVDS